MECLVNHWYISYRRTVLLFVESPRTSTNYIYTWLSSEQILLCEPTIYTWQNFCTVCWYIQSSSLCAFFFHRKNSKLNLPSAHSKSKQLILITQDYGNSCWLVNHYVLLMSEKEGRVKQNSPLKNYSATKIFFFYHGNTTLVSTAEMLHVDFLSTHKKRLNNSHNTGGLSINAKSCVAKTCNHDNRMSAK